MHLQNSDIVYLYVVLLFDQMTILRVRALKLSAGVHLRCYRSGKDHRSV